jgi:hypothetical protein
MSAIAPTDEQISTNVQALTIIFCKNYGGRARDMKIIHLDYDLLQQRYPEIVAIMNNYVMVASIYSFINIIEDFFDKIDSVKMDEKTVAHVLFKTLVIITDAGDFD